MGFIVKCPYCGALDSRVIDSRSVADGVRRRRLCESCGARFTTIEHVHAHNISVVKKDGRREEFSREKLAAGIRKACEKRPLPTGTIEKLIDDIESEFYASGRSEVASRTIGDRVMHGLEDLDHIAYIRFASVYREFKDIGALKQAVDTIVTGRSSRPGSSQLLLPSFSDARSEVSEVSNG